MFTFFKTCEKSGGRKNKKKGERKTGKWRAGEGRGNNSGGE